MEKRYYNEYSHCLERDMEFIVYGHTGIPILVFPCQDGHCQDFEGMGMINTVEKEIEEGKIQLFCVGCIDQENYSDEAGNPAHRSYMLEQYYYYICDEVVPRIKEINGTGQLIYTTGCSMGGTHSGNMALRRPDLFKGCIALSGYYDADLFFGGYVDEYVYNNAPLKYVNGLSDRHPYLQMYKDRTLIFCCGQGAWEDDMVRSLTLLRETFDRKGIPAWTDFWGHDVNHDWPWWRIQFPYFISHIL